MIFSGYPGFISSKVYENQIEILNYYQENNPQATEDEIISVKNKLLEQGLKDYWEKQRVKFINFISE